MTALSHPAELQSLIDRCVQRFAAWRGHKPTAVAAAPGRVNLIGEHTDYNDGYVLPMAIDRWCVAVGSSGQGCVRSEEVRSEACYDPNRPDAAALADQPWARYPVGVLWCVAQGRTSAPALDVLLTSSVPLGAGLSSSASVEIATAALADRLLNLRLSAREQAAIGRRAEHEFAGVPCGIMDQLISAAATVGAATLIDCRSLDLRAVSLPREAVIVVADCGVRHALASGEYAARRESCKRAAAALGVASLRDATLDMLAGHDATLSPIDRACARHVISENARVLQCVAAIETGDLAAAGARMSESHASLRDEYRVSCDELDTLVDVALEIPGVYGSRMTGGGFGGCTVTLCQREVALQVIKALAAAAAEHAMRPFVASPVGPAAAWSLDASR